MKRIVIALMAILTILCVGLIVGSSKFAAKGEQVEICARTGSNRISTKPAWSGKWTPTIHPSSIERILRKSDADRKIDYDWHLEYRNYEYQTGVISHADGRPPEIYALDRLEMLHPAMWEQNWHGLIPDQDMIAVYEADSEQRPQVVEDLLALAEKSTKPNKR